MPELISSAEHLSGEGKKAKFDLTHQAWFTEAWQRFEDGGEFNVAATWIATQESQMVALPKRYDPSTKLWTEENDPNALAVFAMLGSHAEMFRAWGFNSVVTGEAMWAFTSGRWQLVSRISIDTRSDGKFYYNAYGEGEDLGGGNTGTAVKPATLPQITDCYRVFLPSPRRAKLAHTPVKAFLKDLEQLLLFRSVLTSKLKARFWMNGIWVFGQKMTMATQQGKGTAGARGKFLSDLRLLVEANIKRRMDASDVSPIFMQTSTPDVGDVIKQFYPEVTIDAREAEIRREVRATLREMFDLPVEEQTTKSGLNHWGTWSVREEHITDSLEPRAQALLDALSASWYFDQLVAAGMSDADARLRKLVVSSAKLKGRPSSDEVRLAHDRGEASGDALRAATRLTDDEKPDDAERLRILGFKKGNPYLATFGTDIHKEIDWEMVARLNSPGRDGTGGEEVERAPGVGTPGSPTDSNSEVEDD